jgi:hypothetical protein
MRVKNKNERKGQDKETDKKKTSKALYIDLFQADE